MPQTPTPAKNVFIKLVFGLMSIVEGLLVIVKGDVFPDLWYRIIAVFFFFLIAYLIYDNLFGNDDEKW